MSGQAKIDVRSEPRKIKRNWLFWLGSVFVVAGVYFILNFCIRAIKEPEIAGTLLMSGAFICLILAVPGLFLVWRSQKVPEEDLRYQRIKTPVLDDNRIVSCQQCGKEFLPQVWPLGGDEIPYTIQKDLDPKAGIPSWKCQDCGEVNYIVWETDPGKLVKLKKPETMEQTLKSWGTSFIIMGILSVVLGEVFSQVWGIVLIILGILSLTIRKPWMLIALGCTVLLAGILNLLPPSAIIWAGLGILQIYWGIQLILKYDDRRVN